MVSRIFLISALFVLGCSQPKAIIEPVSDDFTVEVKTQGRVVQNFEQQLVHRIDVQPNVARGFKYAASPKLRLPFDLRVEQDAAGTPIGARVVSRNSRALELLGLRPQDLLTAVGASPIRSSNDVRTLLSSFSKDEESSMTIVRNGRPHKMLYRVVE